MGHCFKVVWWMVLLVQLVVCSEPEASANQLMLAPGALAQDVPGDKQCSYNDSFTGIDWWFQTKMETNDTKKFIRSYNNTEETIWELQIEAKQTTVVDTDTMQHCNDLYGHEQNFGNYMMTIYIRKKSYESPNYDVVCVQQSDTQKTLIESNLVAGEDDDYDDLYSRRCKWQDPYEIGKKILLVKEPLDTSLCPFVHTHYHVEVLKRGRYLCHQKKSSNMIVDFASGIIHIDSCLSGDTYVKPFNVQLMCIDDNPAKFVGIDGNDYFYVMARPTDFPNVNSFYTMLYSKPAANGSIWARLHGRRTGSLKPDFNAKKSNKNTFNVTFNMHPACPFAPCKNGGICSYHKCICDDKNSYGVDCQPEPCNPVICKDHGVCNEELSICVCKDGYTGPTCNISLTTTMETTEYQTTEAPTTPLNSTTVPGQTKSTVPGQTASTVPGQTASTVPGQTTPTVPGKTTSAVTGLPPDWCEYNDCTYQGQFWLRITGTLDTLQEGDNMTLKCKLIFDPKPTNPVIEELVTYKWQFQPDFPGQEGNNNVGDTWRNIYVIPADTGYYTCTADITRIITPNNGPQTKTVPIFVQELGATPRPPEAQIDVQFAPIIGISVALLLIFMACTIVVMRRRQKKERAVEDYQLDDYIMPDITTLIQRDDAFFMAPDALAPV